MRFQSHEKRLAQTILLLFTLLFCGQSVAQRLELFTEQLAPFQIVEGEKLTGLAVEIVTELMTLTKLDYSMSAVPWHIAYNVSLRDKYACAFSTARLPQREKLFRWVGPYATSTTSLYALKEDGFVIKSLADAKIYRIAVIRDDAVHHYLLSKGFKEGNNLYPVDNYETMLRLIETQNRYMDLVVSNDDFLKYRVGERKFLQNYEQLFELTDFSLDFYLACNRDLDDDIYQRLTSGLNALKSSAKFNEIKARWGHYSSFSIE